MASCELDWPASSQFHRQPRSHLRSARRRRASNLRGSERVSGAGRFLLDNTDEKPLTARELPSNDIFQRTPVRSVESGNIDIQSSFHVQIIPYRGSVAIPFKSVELCRIRTLGLLGLDRLQLVFEMGSPGGIREKTERGGREFLCFL